MVSQSDLSRYAAENPNTTKLLPSGKLQFTQTGMEFPSTASQKVLEAYAGGSAYRRAVWARQNAVYDFTQHEPWIIPHKHRNESHFLYCKLTSSTIPRRKECVEGHIAGKRFRRKLKKIEKKRADQERISAERKEKAKAWRMKKAMEVQGDGEEKEGEGMEVVQEDDSGKGNAEEEDRDVLAGILSDSDGEMKDEDIRDDKDEGSDSKVGDEEDEKTLDMAIMQDAQEDDGSVFWTRGRAYVADDNVDDEEERERAPRMSVKGSVGKGKASRKGKRGVPGMDVEMENKDSDGVAAIKKDASVEMKTGKRTRSGRPVKKVRRPRQRRKTGAVET